MILFLTHILCALTSMTNLLQTSAFAYLPIAREVKTSCLRIFRCRQPSALFLLHHVRVLILCLRITFGLVEHSNNLSTQGGKPLANTTDTL
jgi:hypothetical protein